jgi:hypothetical protein
MKHFAALSAGFLACAIVSASAPTGHAGEAAPGASPKAIVELFTSQGCSSCVAADAYFSDLAKRKDVVALSLHVDYWDYLGWRDTLDDPAHTDRQRSYAAVRGSNRIYTPQIVVNGRADFVGSDRDGIESAIAQSALTVPVSMKRGEGTIEIEVGGASAPHAGPATIRLVLMTSEAEVAIARGENAGSTIDYYNVVRTMRPIGMWNGEAVKITLPTNELMGKGVDSCAIIVQQDLPKGPGAILGAAWLGGWGGGG